MRKMYFFRRAFFIVIALCITSIAFGQELYENRSWLPGNYGLEGPDAGKNYAPNTNLGQSISTYGAYTTGTWGTFSYEDGFLLTTMEDINVPAGYKWTVDSVEFAVTQTDGNDDGVTSPVSEVNIRVSTLDASIDTDDPTNNTFLQSDLNVIWGDMRSKDAHVLCSSPHTKATANAGTNRLKRSFRNPDGLVREKKNAVTRNIYNVIANTPGLVLTGGRSMIEFGGISNASALGHVSVSNDVKPVSPAGVMTGNAYKYINYRGNYNFAAAHDGNRNMGMWFKVYGTEVITTAPLKATNLSFDGSDNAAVTATLSWTNPTKNGNGDDLPATTKVHVMGNGTIIHTQDLAASTNGVLVNLPYHGVFEFTIVVENDANEKSYESNTEVSGFIGTKRPVEASAFTAEPDAAPAYTAQLEWTNPNTNAFDNGALTALDTVFVLIDGVYTDTLTPATMGATVNHETSVTAPGNHDFSIVTRNAGGQSETAPVSIYVGPKNPAPIADFDVAINPAPSREVTFTWTNPNKNKDGNKLTELSFARFKVAIAGGAIYYDTVYFNDFDADTVQTTRTHTITIPAAGAYSMKMFSVNSAGASGVSNSVSPGWVGPKKAATIADFAAVKNPAPSREVNVTWTNPNTNIDGDKLTELSFVWFKCTHKINGANKQFYDTVYYNDLAADTLQIKRSHTITVPYAAEYHSVKMFAGNSAAKANAVSNIVNLGWVGSRKAQNPTQLGVIANTENLDVKLRWINPSLSIDDTTLHQLNAIMVMDGTDTIATITDTEIGQRVTDYVVTVDTAKIYNFHLVAVNDAGTSTTSNVVDTWVGPTNNMIDQIPATVSDLHVSYSGITTNVTLTWKNPTADIYGFELDSLALIILENGVEIDTLDALESYSYDVKTPGYYTFSVKATSYSVGEATVANKVWCGVKDANPTLSSKKAEFVDKAIGSPNTKAITITNIGYDTLSISGISRTNNIAEFTHNLKETFSLAYNEDYTFYIRYTASSEVALADTLVITYGTGSSVAIDSIAIAGNGKYGGFGFDFDQLPWQMNSIKSNLPLGRETETGYTGFNQITNSGSLYWKRALTKDNWNENNSEYAIELFSEVSSVHDDYIVLPVIKPTADDTLLTFKLFSQALSATDDVDISVQLSKNRNGFPSDTVLHTQTYTADTDGTDHGTIEVNLKDYIGYDSIYVAIRAHNGSPFVQVDDIYAPFVRRFADIAFNIKDTAGLVVPHAQLNFYNDYEIINVNDTGGVVLENYPEGMYSYYISVPGYKLVKSNGALKDELTSGIRTRQWGDTYYNFTLQPISHTITFNVSDINGAPFEGAEVIFGEDTIYSEAANMGQVNFLKVRPTFGKKIAYKVSYGNLGVVQGEFAVSGNKTTNVTLEAVYDYNFKVTDGTTPIEGANVTLGNQTLTTDVNGNVSFVDIAGDYVYTVSADKFETFSGTIFEGAIPAVENVVLDYTKYNVFFSYSDGVNQLPGASINFNGETKTTDANGLATFEGVKIDKFGYTAELAGYMPMKDSVDVVDWDVKVNVQTELVYTVTFNVSDGTDAHQGAIVDFFGQTDTTDATGSVSFINVPVDTAYAYNVSMLGFVSAQGKLDVVDKDVTINAVLDQPANIVTFTVANASGILTGALVTMANENRPTNADGIAQFSVLDGTYNYTVGLFGYDTVAAEVTVVAGADNDIAIDLDSTAYTVAFKVTDENGNVDGAFIAIGGKTLTTVDGAASIDLFVLDGTLTSVKATSSVFDYTVSNEGHHSKTANVDIIDGNVNENVSLDLVKYHAVFTAKYGSEALEGVSLSINDGATTLTTDVHGSDSMYVVPGTYNYTATLDGYATESGSVVVSDTNVYEDIAMELETFPVTFNITDENGNVEGAKVFLNLNEYVFESDTNGVATTNVVPGEYSYEIRKEGAITASGTINVVDAAVSNSIELKLVKYTATFVVSNGNGTVEGASITVNSETLTSDASGEVSITATPGTYQYTVAADNHNDKTGSLELNTDSITEAVKIDLTRYYAVFNVSDENGAIKGASIVIDGETLTTDANGVDSIYLVIGKHDYTVAFDSLHATTSGSVNIVDTTVTTNVDLALIRYNTVFTVTNNVGAVDSAVISINNDKFTLTTGTNGMDSIMLEPGKYSYTVNATEHFEEEGEFEVTLAKGNVNIAVELKALTHVVTFKVSDGTDMLAGANVIILDDSIATDDAGKARFNLVNDTYNYTVSLEGYDDATGTVVVDGSAKVENVTLTETGGEPTYDVTFVVTNNTSSDVIEGATVTILDEAIATNTEGKAIFNLANKTYNYTVSFDGYDDATGTVVVDGSAKVENVTLSETSVEPTYSVTFVVTNNTSSDVVEGAVIEFNNMELTTDINGTAVFEQVSVTTDAPYTVTKDNFETYTGTVSVVDTDVQVDVAFVPVGINDNNAVNFSVYPNPANNYTVVEADYAITQIQVMNLNGQLVQLIDNLNETRVQVELSDYSQGVYYLYVNTENGKAVKKLVVR